MKAAVSVVMLVCNCSEWQGLIIKTLLFATYRQFSISNQKCLFQFVSNNSTYITIYELIHNKGLLLSKHL